MKTNALVGVILIIVGVICLIYGGIGYTKKEKVIDIGPLQVEAEKEKKIPIPPIVGLLALGAGVTILLVRKG
jgi:uncharacterized membrane protein YidH (DUF202 family)